MNVIPLVSCLYSKHKSYFCIVQESFLCTLTTRIPSKSIHLGYAVFYYKASLLENVYFLWIFYLQSAIILDVFILLSFRVVGLLMIIHMKFISFFAIFMYFFLFYALDNETYPTQNLLLFDCWCLIHTVHPSETISHQCKSLQILNIICVVKARALQSGKLRHSHLSS